MKTLTLNVQITVKIPEFDPDGDPKSEEDENLLGTEVTILKNGVEVSPEESETRSDTRYWDLLPNEENFTLGIEFGYY